MIATIIAFLALLVSLAILVIQYRNQLERRHAEIVQLQAQMIAALSSMSQRIASSMLHGEIMRIELRRLPDSQDKWACIEKMPRLLAGMEETKNEIDKVLKQLEKIDTQKVNRSAALISFQKYASTLQKALPVAEHCEEEIRSILTSVRNDIGPNTANPDSAVGLPKSDGSAEPQSGGGSAFGR